MGAIATNNIRKTFGNVDAVDGISLAVRDGEFMVLLGPSGCGKTTYLRIIAGLEKQTEGDVRINGDVVNELPPRARGVAMVFQSYGLYPHFTVRNNIAFPLRTQRVPKPADRPESCVVGTTARHRTPARPPARANCPAASGSASRLPGPWCVIRAYFCSTNRCPILTPSCVPRRATRSDSSNSALRPPPFMSRMTRLRRWAWATASR